MSSNDALAVAREQNRQKRLEFYEGLRGIVQEMIDEGKSYRKIIKALNDQGYTNRFGRKWGLNNFSTMMRHLNLSTVYMKEAS